MYCTIRTAVCLALQEKSINFVLIQMKCGGLNFSHGLDAWMDSTLKNAFNHLSSCPCACVCVMILKKGFLPVEKRRLLIAQWPGQLTCH